MKMKTRLFVALVLGVYFAFMLTLADGSNSQETMKQLFETRYKAYKDFMGSSKYVILSDTTGTNTLYYKEIIKLGPEALPYIMEKMKEDPRLWYAVRVITKKWWTADERANMGNKPWAQLYLDWWKNRSKEPELFDQLYNQWRDLRNQGSELEAKNVYAKMVRMGISILPYAMEKIEKGDIAMVSIVRALSEFNNKKDATVHECVDWWKKNKEKWTLPE